MYVYILLSQTKSRDHQNVASWHTGSVANTGTTTHCVANLTKLNEKLCIIVKVRIRLILRCYMYQLVGVQ